MFRKKDLIVFAISLVFAAFYTWVGWQPHFFFNAANFTFCIGMFHIIVGLWVWIKNIGVFRLFTYMAYKISFRRHGHADHSAKPLSFAEYAMEVAKRRSTIKEYFIIGLPFVAISYLFVFAHMGL
ncbi:MAG: DUF3899 domain-containing protein [Defluviitaleaceae bacterium]|nr:DUF3899 domain-containing protein [Defluviitaleaceae bacterium]